MSDRVEQFENLTSLLENWDISKASKILEYILNKVNSEQAEKQFISYFVCSLFDKIVEDFEMWNYKQVVNNYNNLYRFLSKYSPNITRTLSDLDLNKHKINDFADNKFYNKHEKNMFILLANAYLFKLKTEENLDWMPWIMIFFFVIIFIIIRIAYHYHWNT